MWWNKIRTDILCVIYWYMDSKKKTTNIIIIDLSGQVTEIQIHAIRISINYFHIQFLQVYIFLLE